MFWIDGATIYRSDLSGNNRSVLVTSSAGGLVSPTKLVVDVTSQRLYWLDAAASNIGSVHFDGSDVTTWSRPEFARSGAIAVFEVEINSYHHRLLMEMHLIISLQC